MSGQKIIGPIFVQVIVDTKAYLHILSQIVAELNDKELPQGHFQQDGTTRYTSKGFNGNNSEFLRGLRDFQGSSGKGKFPSTHTNTFFNCLYWLLRVSVYINAIPR
jgi:hypothetical protein